MIAFYTLDVKARPEAPFWIWFSSMQPAFLEETSLGGGLWWTSLEAFFQDCALYLMDFCTHLFLESQESPNVPTHMVWVFGTSFFWKEIALEINQIYLSFLKLATSRDRLWVQFLLAITLSVTPGPFVQHTNHFPATTLLFLAPSEI